eukprot:4364301-Karenia_brevis.AAC.1
MKARGGPSMNPNASAKMRWGMDELKRVPERGQPYVMLDHDQRSHRWRTISYYAISAISDLVGDRNLKAQIINSGSQSPHEQVQCAC